MVRAAVFLTDGEKVLICHAPNKKHEVHTWDLPKGHAEANEDAHDCAVRELFEETGLTIDYDKTQMIEFGPLPYFKDEMTILILKMATEDLPPIESMKCTSYFDWYGKQLPEVNEFQYVDFRSAVELCYNSLAKPIQSAIMHLYKVFGTNN